MAGPLAPRVFLILFAIVLTIFTIEASSWKQSQGSGTKLPVFKSQICPCMTLDKVLKLIVVYVFNLSVKWANRVMLLVMKLTHMSLTFSQIIIINYG